MVEQIPCIVQGSLRGEFNLEDLIQLKAYPVKNVLKLLLVDKTTKQNIVFATDSYAHMGSFYFAQEHIDESKILGLEVCEIQPRISKSQAQQIVRTRVKAEVFTPSWICNKMNNNLDEQWFGRIDVFNKENADKSWTVNEDHIKIPEGKTWKEYIDSRCLEITCGEAPFIVSCYDTSTGHKILPPKRRVGLLDRKLRIVSENTKEVDEWMHWVIRAYQSTYGYEWQGDNLLIARINLLVTFVEYMQDRWNRLPNESELKKITNIITWNIWQMDGLKGIIPYSAQEKTVRQMSVFDGLKEQSDKKIKESVYSKIYDWRSNRSVEFISLKEMSIMKKFDFAIGNPPYQEDTDNKGDRPNPLYNDFMDQAYKVANKVELITPARFLFNAGQTPKAWNEKMLLDDHFKVLHYESDATKIFPTTDIKGGIAITLRSSDKLYGAIGTFTTHPELNSILKKVKTVEGNNFRLDSIIASQGLYRFSDLFFEKHPEVKDLSGKGTGNKIVSNIIDKMPEIFLEFPFEGCENIRLLGRINNKRQYRYIKREFIVENDYIDTYNLFLPEANSSGKFGETLTEPTIGYPGDGSADTFLSAGKFKNRDEPENLSIYIKTKFFRAMLGVKKVTQHCPPSVWEIIPLQDFSDFSDLAWSKSTHEIDLQLYKKYGLSAEEINFIETNVKEME